jgi:glucose/arabinose dehydrogenase
LTLFIYFYAGRLFLCEKQGMVRVIKDDVLLSTPAFTISNLNNNNERGLLGIVFDPDFDSNGFVYVHYTYTNGSNYSQVSRFTLSGDTAVANSEQKLITLDKHDTNGGVHNGGAIRIANNKLFMFVGNLGGSHSQNMASPYGKSLRFNLDGSIPTDNPFYDSASGKISRTF